MSQTGARAVVEAAHVDIAEDIKQAVKDLKERLQIKDSDDFASVLKKVNAQAAVRMARNKTKSVITKNNFDAVRTWPATHLKASVSCRSFASRTN